MLAGVACASFAAGFLLACFLLKRIVHKAVSGLDAKLEALAKELSAHAISQHASVVVSEQTQTLEASVLGPVLEPASVTQGLIEGDVIAADAQGASPPADFLLVERNTVPPDAAGTAPAPESQGPIGADREEPIRHLVVTRSGDRWVRDPLPKDDYKTPNPAPPSVHALISKPVGYRLVAAHNLLRDDDPADAGTQLLDEERH